ncbi:MAG: hypothetical protein AAFN07_10305 [Pseudomonadota bacterium]
MELLEYVETLESRINSYWNFYIVVVFANAGWIFNGYGSIPVFAATTLSIGLTLFFLSNLSFQIVALNNLSAAREEITNRIGGAKYRLLFGRNAIERIPYRKVGTCALHLTIGAGLMLLLFAGTG